MNDDPYAYPGTNILINLLNIKDTVTLELAERQLSATRQRDGCPEGQFDLTHLRAIHKHLFQDIYDWAGQIRSVEIAKGDSVFQARAYIEVGMADVHARLVKADFLKGLNVQEFADRVGPIIGDVNYVHPFREGNGRTQLQYLKQLTAEAGHILDLTKIDKQNWLGASQAAHCGNYRPMSDEIAGVLGERSRLSDRGDSRDADFATELRRLTERDQARDRDYDRE